jgi:hypothetical protein
MDYAVAPGLSARISGPAERAERRPCRDLRATRSLPRHEPDTNSLVFDAADLNAESAFRAGMLDKHVFDDEAFHSVIDPSGEWRIGVQLATGHVPPAWPDGAPPQQAHIDLHVETRSRRTSKRWP